VLTLLVCLAEQVTLIVTNAIDRLFTKNPRYDGRSLLGGLQCPKELAAPVNSATAAARLHGTGILRPIS
jgi:hypothetical protein